MSIALLTYSTKPRGSVIHTLELAAALQALGQAVWIYALDKDGQGFDPPPPGPVQLVPAQDASASIDALIEQRIQEFVAFIGAETRTHTIYHAQDCIGANALLELRQRGRISAFVRTVHHIEDYASPYLQRCQEQSIRQADLCLCVSDRWQQALQTEYGIAAPRVLNGVNLERFSASPSGREAELKRHYGLSGGPIFLTVGGIEPRKNSIHLLQSFAQVLKIYPRAQLVIAGGATLFDYQPYRDQFFAAVSALAIQVGQSLILPGVIPAPDLPILYRCADAFCFPSRQEGWGLVVLEAIASGLPVIVPQQAPFTEFLAPDQALWVNPDVPETIAAAMVQAISSDVSTTINRSRTILPHYSWPHSARIHLQHYHRIAPGLPIPL